MLTSPVTLVARAPLWSPWRRRSPRLNDLRTVQRQMVYPYYENGEGIIVLGSPPEMARALSIDKRTIPQVADHIIGFAHIPHQYFRDNPRNPTLDMGPVLPLTEYDLDELARITQLRLEQNKKVVYHTGSAFFRFREKSLSTDTFYFDVHDMTRSGRRPEHDTYGIGGLYVFDNQRLQDFLTLVTS